MQMWGGGVSVRVSGASFTGGENLKWRQPPEQGCLIALRARMHGVGRARTGVAQRETAGYI